MYIILFYPLLDLCNTTSFNFIIKDHKAISMAKNKWKTHGNWVPEEMSALVTQLPLFISSYWEGPDVSILISYFSISISRISQFSNKSLIVNTFTCQKGSASICYIISKCISNHILWKHSHITKLLQISSEKLHVLQLPVIVNLYWYTTYVNIHLQIEL